MSLNSKLTINGQKHNLVVEWNEAGYSLTISLEKEDGQRVQFVRVPLLDFLVEDLSFLSAYLNAFITSLDPEEMWHINQMGNTTDEDDGMVG